eukprot:jgi/Tetstr1/444665/TSEL_032513.t1
MPSSRAYWPSIVSSEMMAYFHSAPRLCGGLREYNLNHLQYQDPRERNLVICTVGAAGDGGEGGWDYQEEDIAHLLGEWERTHCVGRVYHVNDKDKAACGQHELELRLFEPWILQPDTGKPDKPLWVANRDAGGTLPTAWGVVQDMLWLPITNLPIDHFEVFYNDTGVPIPLAARMREKVGGYDVVNMASIRKYANNTGTDTKIKDALMLKVQRNLCEYALRLDTNVEMWEGVILPPDCHRRLDLMHQRRDKLGKLDLTQQEWLALLPKKHKRKRKNKDSSEDEDDSEGDFDM